MGFIGRVVSSVLLGAALGILPGLAMTSAAKVQQLTSLIRGGSQAERQGAFEVFGTLKTAESREALGQYLDELQAGRIAPELQLDDLLTESSLVWKDDSRHFGCLARRRLQAPR